jgi:hypothetical protein
MPGADAAATLTIGKREGAFPGMKNERTFEVVLVRRTPGTFAAANTHLRVC